MIPPVPKILTWRVLYEALAQAQTWIDGAYAAKNHIYGASQCANVMA